MKSMPYLLPATVMLLDVYKRQGECYVTVDGHEADLDLGHYERFLEIGRAHV